MSDRHPCILLSAGMPPRSSDYRLSANERHALDETVLQLSRAVFSRGGRLVFGGHPAISPLVATVAGEYAPPPEGDVRGEQEVLDQSGEDERESIPQRAQAVIYQSEVFRGHLPDETLLLFRLGFAQIVWTPRIGEERFDSRSPMLASQQCPRSLNAMRERMVSETRPDAMICAGGAAGVEEEAELFRQLLPNASIYVMAGTGGAAARLAERHDGLRVRVRDRELLHQLIEAEHDHPVREWTPGQTGEDGERPSIRATVLYPLVVQAIVHEIISDHREPERRRERAR